MNSPKVSRSDSCAIRAQICAIIKNIPAVNAAVRCGGLSLCSPVSGQAAVVFNSRIQTLGRYAFILHYYQPNHPTFPVEVLINGGRIWQGEQSGHLLENSPAKFFVLEENCGFSGAFEDEARLTHLFQTGRV